MFVTVANTGTSEEDVGGFFVHQALDGEDATNDFKFPADFKLASEQTVTIWSENQGVKANPPNEFVLSGNWMSGGASLETSVVNTESEIVAQHTITTSAVDQVDSSSSKIRREASKESCVVM